MTLSVARSESLRGKSVVLPPSAARRVVEKRSGEGWVTEAMDGVGVGRRALWSFVLASGDAEVSSSVDLRVKSPNTMVWAVMMQTRRDCDIKEIWICGLKTSEGCVNLYIRAGDEMKGRDQVCLVLIAMRKHAGNAPASHPWTKLATPGYRPNHNVFNEWRDDVALWNRPTHLVNPMEIAKSHGIREGTNSSRNVLVHATKIEWHEGHPGVPSAIR